MAYKLDYLPLAANDILEAEAGLLLYCSVVFTVFYYIYCKLTDVQV